MKTKYRVNSYCEDVFISTCILFELILFISIPTLIVFNIVKNMNIGYEL